MRTKSERGWLAGWAVVGTLLLAACAGKNAETEGTGGSGDKGAPDTGAGRAGGGSNAWGTGGTGQAGTWEGDDETEINGGTGPVVAGSGWGGTGAAPSWGGTDAGPSWGGTDAGPSWGGTSQENDGGTGGMPWGGMPSDPDVTCNDGFKDDYESDIDCGGQSCGPCPAASSCWQHRDCKSQVCRSKTCQSATCEDEVKNGSETGVDCGGSCKPCS
jgi:hypothetical protein